MKKVEEFDAVDDNQKMYRVLHFKKVINVADLDHPYATKLGQSEYRLSNGDSLNRVSDTEFEVVRPQTRIFRK